MKIFDFNVHFSSDTYNSGGRTLLEETRMGSGQLLDAYGRYRKMMPASNGPANYMVLNSGILSDARLKGLLSAIRKDNKRSCVTLLVDFRKKTIQREIEKARDIGFDGIKLHSYIQRIAPADFRKASEACESAQARNMFICIDTSYGTSGLFTFDNLKLAAYLAERVTKVPLVLLHSGAVRIWEAMLIAASGNNIYLETSFSIPYLSGSSREEDMAFCYKKLGADKILYGSDFPYVGLGESLSITMKFLKKHHFKKSEIDKIMFTNAVKLKERCG